MPQRSKRSRRREGGDASDRLKKKGPLRSPTNAPLPCPLLAPSRFPRCPLRSIDAFSAASLHRPFTTLNLRFATPRSLPYVRQPVDPSTRGPPALSSVTLGPRSTPPFSLSPHVPACHAPGLGSPGRATPRHSPPETLSDPCAPSRPLPNLVDARRARMWRVCRLGRATRDERASQALPEENLTHRRSERPPEPRRNGAAGRTQRTSSAPLQTRRDDRATRARGCPASRAHAQPPREGAAPWAERASRPERRARAARAECRNGLRRAPRASWISTQ